VVTAQVPEPQVAGLAQRDQVPVIQGQVRPDVSRQDMMDLDLLYCLAAYAVPCRDLEEFSPAFLP
jgi:hypothetical protein